MSDAPVFSSVDLVGLARRLEMMDFGIGSYWGGEFCRQITLTPAEQEAIVFGLRALAGRPKEPWPQSAALAAKDAEIARWRAALDAAAWLRRNMKKGPLFWYIEGSSCAENFIAKMNILAPPGAEP